MKWIDMLENSPVIAAVKDDEGLNKALQTDCMIVFILYGNICNIGEIVSAVKNAGKTAIVHVELVQGFSSKEIVVDYVGKHLKADGIISTKNQLVKRATELDMIGILRTFIFDSIALENMKKQFISFKPDAIEILPGIVPRVIREIRKHMDIPVIAGGLLAEKKDVMEAFDAGASAVSTTREALWYV